MSVIRPERKIAIAFLRPFRDYVDKMLKPTQEYEKTADRIRESVDETIETMMGDGIDIPQDLQNDLKALMVNMNVSGAKALDPLYFKLLNEIVDNVHAYLERVLLDKFTEDELAQLADIAELEVIRKIVGLSNVYEFLGQQRRYMKEQMQDALFEHIEKEGFNEQMNNLFGELMKRTGGRGFGWNFFHEDDPP